MRASSTDVTAWEIEAARRREVVETDFAAGHTSRNGHGSELETHDVRTGRVRRLLSAFAPAPVAAAPARTERASACNPGIGAIEPGA